MRSKAKRRGYNSRARRAAADQTRTAILDEASRHFLRDGYGATTIAAIAKRAGVSVETIYKTFGGKPGLVRAIRDRGLAGAGPVHAEHRSDAMQARETRPRRASPDPRRMFRAWAALAAEVSPRVSPILLLVREAATHDPEMAELQRQLDNERLARMNHNAAAIAKLGVRGSRRRARDILWLATAPELYELLVARRGWSLAAYSELIAQLLTGTLLP
jgi:AcrR family transcriptional regulator